MGDGLDNHTIAKAYARWAPVYDRVFGAVFERGRMAAIAAAEAVGGRILEVGVGTGISLPDYRRSNRLIGVDLSEPMLRKAQERVVNEALDHVDGVAVMDARRLGFPDAFFDVVVAQYVITVVPDPDATLDEFARVARPGGRGWRPGPGRAPAGPLPGNPFFFGAAMRPSRWACLRASLRARRTASAFSRVDRSDGFS